MAFKLQVESPNGWADLKESVDDGPHRLVTYATEEEAAREAKDIDSVRVVPADTPSDDELYD